MKIIGACICVLFVSVVLFAADPFDSKKLVSFLPKDNVEGFTRIAFDSMAPVDRMTSAMVQYIKIPAHSQVRPEIISVSISIMDGNLYRDSIDKQIAPNSKDDEAVMVKGKYKGVRNNKGAGSGDKNAMVTWIVGGRFLVSIHLTGSNDYSLAERFIELVDLKGLDIISN